MEITQATIGSQLGSNYQAWYANGERRYFGVRKIAPYSVMERQPERSPQLGLVSVSVHAGRQSTLLQVMYDINHALSHCDFAAMYMGISLLKI